MKSRSASSEEDVLNRRQILDIEKRDKEEEASTSEEHAYSSAEPDVEEKPYFKKVVYQSKYSIHDKRKRRTTSKKKSFFRSIRRPWGFNDDSDDEDDYEVPEGAYIKSGNKQETTSSVSVERNNEAYRSGNADQEAVYENV